jgi:hypothetical protein
MDGTLLAAAASAGLLGSLHCAAMCGPLAIAGCGAAGGGGTPKARSVLGYFGGRLLGYVAAGALVGQLGRHALCVLPMSTIQTIAVVLVAGFALWRAWGLFRPAAAPREPLVELRAGRPRASAWSGFVAGLIPRRGLALGLATAILPCGMLVAAWTLAAGSGGSIEGATVMAVFAAASLPGLVVPIAARRIAEGALRRLPRRAVGAAWCVLALWLAVRPLLSAVHQH